MCHLGVPKAGVRSIPRTILIAIGKDPEVHHGAGKRALLVLALTCPPRHEHSVGDVLDCGHLC